MAMKHSESEQGVLDAIRELDEAMQLAGVRGDWGWFNTWAIAAETLQVAIAYVNLRQHRGSAPPPAASRRRSP